MKITMDQARERLAGLDNWELDENAIGKEFKFKDFAAAFAFMTEVAAAAEALGHHPDWSNNYNKVHVKLTSHSEGGLTDLDFELARRMDELAA